MGVEPTSRAAKERDNGFEDREDHRAPFASASSIAWISTLDRRVPRESNRGEACYDSWKALLVTAATTNLEFRHAAWRRG